MQEKTAPLDDVAKKQQNISMDDLTSNEVMPEVKENAIEAVKQSGQSAPVPTPQAPSQKLKKDGTPAAKRGRKPNAEKQGVSGSYLKGENQDQKIDPMQSISSEHAAAVVSGVLERAQVVLISDDFILSDIERAANIKAWANTFDYYGGVKMTPPQALMIDHLGIILSRIPKPKTQSKLKLFTAWMNDKIKNRKWFKKDALPDRGTDSQRENDLRKEKAEKP